MISGKTLDAVLDGASVAGCYKWDVEETGVELDNATSSSGGYDNPEVGLQGLTVNIHGWFDVGVTDVSGLGVGSLVTAAVLKHATGLTAYSFALGIVTRFTFGAEVRGKIDFSATVKTKGAFTRGAGLHN